jgi:choline dehydrogenase
LEQSILTHHKGPYSVVSANIIAQLGLPVIAPDDYSSVASDLESLDPASLLPSYAHETVVAGYAAQLKYMAAAARSNNTAWLQFGLRGLTKFNVNNMHPLSRGYVNINISNPNGEPVVNYRALTNPLDLRIEVLLLKSIRNYFAREGDIQKLSPVEVTPGPNVTTDADLAKYVQDTVTPTQYHPLGTCSKMPVELGGVVDEELRVHGIQQLSIVDASIIPLIIGGTTQATVYAVAEKVRRSRQILKHLLKH